MYLDKTPHSTMLVAYVWKLREIIVLNLYIFHTQFPVGVLGLPIKHFY